MNSMNAMAELATESCVRWQSSAAAWADCRRLGSEFRHLATGKSDASPKYSVFSWLLTPRAARGLVWLLHFATMQSKENGHS